MLTRTPAVLGSILIVALLVVGCDRFPASSGSASDDPHYSEQQFDELVAKSPLTLIKFGAPWCGPCRMLDEELPNVTGDVEIVSINVDNNPELSARYRISGIPHMIMFRDGQRIDERTGYYSADELSKWAAGFSHSSDPAL
ncbi:Thioredoxin [Rosistilla oblonga]|uniref:Thioredoxin n=1 Tax=Rosistilla oblonga TaxID=2527990 RepID=A0A518IXZ5_9BACT|nr:thioredoxin family protein [Rosistilla oblonga]QDV13841.1 Thioredoxin [Rosistilla oblonga]QDV57959.1 Thioredoxin [Rosistilla oblonga]